MNAKTEKATETGNEFVMKASVPVGVTINKKVFVGEDNETVTLYSYTAKVLGSQVLEGEERYSSFEECKKGARIAVRRALRRKAIESGLTLPKRNKKTRAKKAAEQDKAA